MPLSESGALRLPTALAVAVSTCCRFTTPDKQFIAPGTAPGRQAGANDTKPACVSDSYGRTEPDVPAEDPHAIDAIAQAPTSPAGR
jgi:hypothetical protein